MAERRGISPDSQGVYQSYMNAVTDEEPLVIVPIGEVRERDEQYAGPPYMFPFVVPGRNEDPDDQQAFFFLVENEEMAQAMMEGDEDLGVDPLPVGREVRFSTRGQGEDAQAVWDELSDQEYAEASNGPYSSVMEKYADCLDAAAEVADNFLGDEYSKGHYIEFVRNVATHFSMSFSDRGLPLRTPVEKVEDEDQNESDVPDEVEEAVADADDLPF